MAGKKTGKQNKKLSKIHDWMFPTVAEGGTVTWSLCPEKDEVISQWARNGLTKAEIAGQIGISESTLSAWIKKCPNLSEALKNARAYAHARVENALFKKAVGFTITKQQPVKVKVEKYDGIGKKIGTEEEVRIIEITEEVPPDMGAIAFYLKNNLPEKYKDKWPDQSKDDKDQEEFGAICMKTFVKTIADEAVRWKGSADAES